ncbi:MOSC domain containing protein [Pseudohyphozyma bogoriensis]|nr:MOSC domain containing protein [Pseudohyphozyma bogoriensis]
MVTLSSQDLLVTALCVTASVILKWRDSQLDYPSLMVKENCLIIPAFDGDDLVLTARDGSVLKVALNPSTTNLKPLEIDMHNSKVVASDMGDEAAAFFSRASGVETRMCFMPDDRSRPVLGTLSQGKDNGLAFNDCGSYMVSTTSSLDALSQAMGKEMDIVPLRPNILLEPRKKGGVKPWAEDYWSELRFAGKVSMRLTANCVRCVSLNIDYSTGSFKPDAPNLPLKVLAKDRRVDAGSFSPVFASLLSFLDCILSLMNVMQGRYGFIDSKAEAIIRRGDVVKVTKRNVARTIFDWPLH